MSAIQNVMRRFLFVVNLHTIKAALLRLYRKPTPQVLAISKPTNDAPVHESPYADDDDPDDRFAAWEAARADTLQQAEQCERHGVRLLARAALLRTSVRCDDRGETFIAQELREHADEPSVPESAWSRPMLRVVAAEDEPTTPCA